MHEKTDAAIQVRIEGQLFKDLENWRRSQDKIPPRSQALRLLIEQALASKHKPGEHIAA
jgi:hypothetical protein